MLPVVGGVHDDIEAPGLEGASDGLQFAAVGLKVLNLRPQIVRRAAVHHRHLVATLDQELDDSPAHELHAADDEYAHPGILRPPARTPLADYCT